MLLMHQFLMNIKLKPWNSSSLFCHLRWLENHFSASFGLISPFTQEILSEKHFFKLSILYKQKMCMRNGLGTRKKALTKCGYLVFKA